MRTRLVVALAVVLLLAGRVSSRADQNLLVNPNFDTGLSGWQTEPFVSDSTANWDGALDADGSPSSGSAQQVFSADAVHGLSAVLFQCVPLKHGGTYVLGGEIFIPEGNTTTGGAFLSVVPYGQSTDCTGTPPPFRAWTPLVTAVGQWTAGTVTINTLPNSSVAIALILEPDGPGTFTANFDNLFFVEGRPCRSESNQICLNDD